MINVAVIGAGNMGKNHVRIYAELEEANLVAIADKNKSRKKLAEKFSCRFYEDYREMVEKESINAVSIALPTSLHKEASIFCLEKSLHVLVEKPIASSVKEAREIINAAEKNNRVLMVGHIERFNPAVMELKKIIKENKLGEIISLSARRVGIFPPQIKDANVILDLAIHDIDVFNYLLEKAPERVYAEAEKALNSKREDHAFIMLSYGKVLGFIQVNWITPVKIRELAVTGKKGYAEIDYIMQSIRIYRAIYEREYDSFGDFVLKFGKAEKEEIEIEKKEPLKIELRHFIECIERGRKPISSGEDAMKALEIAENIMKALKKE